MQRVVTTASIQQNCTVYFQTLNLNKRLSASPVGVEAVSNTSIVALRVVRGDEKGTQWMGL
jgi:hypothetical protein